MAAPMQHGSSNQTPSQPSKPPVPGGIGSSPTSMQSAAPQDPVITENPGEDMVSSVKKLFRSFAAKKKQGGEKS